MSNSSQADIEDYGAEYVIAPASKGFSPVIDEILHAGGTQVVSATNTVIHNVNFTTPDGATMAKITWNCRQWTSNAAGGPYSTVQVKLDGVLVFPRGQQTDNSFANSTIIENAQSTFTEWHTSTFWLPSLSAGSHNIQLLLSPTHSAGTLALDWNLLSIEFF